jgi:hypothetical protein
MLNGLGVGPNEKQVRNVGLGDWKLMDVPLKAICGTGDDAAPVITVLLLDEGLNRWQHGHGEGPGPLVSGKVLCEV